MQTLGCRNMAEGSGGIRQCYMDIAKAETSGDFDRALKAANRLLKKFPKEGKYAFKCKLVALIQLGQFDDALILLNKTPVHDMGPALFERGYVYYRLNKPDEALEALSKCDASDYRAMELKAQILYRTDRFEEAYDLYKHLVKNHSDDNDDERNANIIAVEAQLAMRGIRNPSLVNDLETFEQLYNASCVDMESGKLKDALKKLDKALPICHKSLADSGLAEEEIEEEAASLAVQRAYVLHKMGRVDDAVEIYNRTEKSKPSDASVYAALLNNIACIALSNNMNESKKKLKLASQVDKSKLGRNQLFTLLLNQALILVLTNQREPARRIIDEIISEYGKKKEVQLVEAALYWKADDALKAVSSLLSDDLASILAKTHILVNLGETEKAWQVLSSIDEKTKKRAGIVSLLVTLEQTIGKEDVAVETLNKALEEVKSDEGKEKILTMLSAVESARGRHDKAALYLEKLNKLHPSDLSITCRLIRAYSHCQPSKADLLREKMFPDESRSVEDMDELEESDWILYGDRYKQKKEAKDVVVEDKEIVTGKLRKRKRKRTILPKNFDPNATPDPERWLPKEERSTYKKKRKNREKEVGRGTQGAAAPSVEYKGADPTSSPRPSVPVSEGPRQQRPTQQKKKKAKGGKW